MDTDEQIRMYNMTDYYIGLGLALSSSGFIGMYFDSFIIILFNYYFTLS